MYDIFITRQMDWGKKRQLCELYLLHSWKVQKYGRHLHNTSFFLGIYSQLQFAAIIPKKKKKTEKRLYNKTKIEYLEHFIF